MSDNRSVTVSAPGKTNLFLAVGPLLPDGFHEVVSLYLALNLREEIKVSLAETWSVEVSGSLSADQIAAVPVDKTNLVIQSAKHLAGLAGFNHPRPVIFEIFKNVPVAGGMGGGSADAAAALVAVNELWCAGVKLETANLVDLGADVPFALTGGIAIGRGRGEQLTSVETSMKFHLVLVKSDEGLSTPAVYERLDQLRLARGDDPRGVAEARIPENLTEALRSGDLQLLVKSLKNDLQEAALDLRPDLRAVISAGLALGALTGFISGSGPTIAFLAADAASARSIASGLAEQGFCSFATSGPAAGALIKEEH